MSAEGPLRRAAQDTREGGGFAAAHLPARRAGYGAAPPASRTLRVSCGNGLRPSLTPETSAAPEAGTAVRPRACPGQARGAQARGSGRLQAHRRQEQSELAFDTQKKRRKNYTNAGPATRSGSLITAEPPGEAASHRTRCARNPGCSTHAVAMPTCDTEPPPAICRLGVPRARSDQARGHPRSSRDSTAA